MGQIVTISQLPQKLQDIKPTGQSIVLVGGCFDIIHAGHVEFLKKAKALGGTLIVMLESDEKVRILKGKSRPINLQLDRAYLLAHLQPVDIVIPLPNFTQDEEYFELVVNTIKPDIIALTKGDPVIRFAKNQAKEVGAKIVEVIERKKGYSTGKILEKIGRE